MNRNAKNDHPLSRQFETRRNILKLVPMTALYYFSAPLVFAAEQIDIPKKKKLIAADKKSLELGSLSAHHRMPLERSVDQRLIGVINKALPSSEEEEILVRNLADQFSHAIAEVAVNPRETFASGSFASHFQRKFLKLDAAKRASIEGRAKSVLSMPLPERRMYFGDFSDQGLRAHKEAYATFDLKLQQQVTRTIKETTRIYRQDIIDFLNDEASIRFSKTPRFAVPREAARVSKTKLLDVGNFISTEFPRSYGLETTLNSPNESRDFKWKTEEAEAKIGVWKVFEMPANKVVATGAAGDAPQGVFRIDFKRFIPSTPPDKPLTYHVKVFPYPESPDVKLGQRAILQEPVGPSSPPAIITYVKSGVPITPFDIKDVYREIELSVDWIKMVQESCEIGSEYFHITGFAQEWPSDELRRIAHKVAEIDPDGERKKTLGSWEGETQYHLQNPDAVCMRIQNGDLKCWPKVLTASISVMEEDDGESISRWMEAIFDMAQGIIGDAIRGAILKELKNFVEEFTDYLIEEVLNNIDLLGDAIDMLAGYFISIISGVVSKIIGQYVSAIIEGMGDDYHGTEVFVLALPNNFADYIHSLPGSIEPGGRYALRQEVSDWLRGPACPLGASSWDGAVTVAVHWRFKDKEQI